MNRHALGLIALLLVAIGFIATFRGPESAAGFGAGCLRVGLVLGALWLALPQLIALAGKMPRWLVGWFFRSNSAKNSQAENSQVDRPPPVKVRRPRRRSNSS